MGWSTFHLFCLFVYFKLGWYFQSNADACDFIQKYYWFHLNYYSGLIMLIFGVDVKWILWRSDWLFWYCQSKSDFFREKKIDRKPFICTETMPIFQHQLFFIILNNLDFDPKFFWAWTDFQSYLDFMLAVWCVGAIITYFLLPFTMFMESVGFLAVFIEAMLGKLTVVRLKRHSQI